MASVPPPRGATGYSAVAATADGSRFFLSAAVSAGSASKPSGPLNRVGPMPITRVTAPSKWRRPASASAIHRLRLSRDGRVSALTMVPGGALITGGNIRFLAATSDGSRVAFLVDNLFAGAGFLYGRGEIDVVNTATGHRSAWTTAASGLISNLSWSADNRRLAFTWAGAAAGNGIRVLSTGAGQDLLKASVLVTPEGGSQLGTLTGPVLSADGTKIYVTASQPDRAGGGPWTRLLELSESGRELRVLFQRRYVHNPANGGWLWTAMCRDPSGQHLLVFAGNRLYRIDVATGHAAGLPSSVWYPIGTAW